MTAPDGRVGIYDARLHGAVRERRRGSFRGIRHGGGDFVIDAVDEIGISLLLNNPRGSRRLDGRTYTEGAAGWVSVMVPGHPFAVRIPDPTVAIQIRYPTADIEAAWLRDHDRTTRIEDIPPNPGGRDDGLAGLLCRGARGHESRQEEVMLEVGLRLLDLADPRGKGRRAAEVKRGGLSPHRLRKAKDMIEDRLRDQVTLADVAAEIGMSPFHFARAWRRETGQSCLDYILGRRISRALCAMDSTTAPLEQIAVAAGFSHASHLNRHLVHRFGMPASRMRDLMML